VQLCSQYGPVMLLVVDGTRVLVTFQTKEAAVAALALNGSELQGQTVAVSLAEAPASTFRGLVSR
jgi:hypothetical protein